MTLKGTETYSPIVQIDRFPIWIITRVKRSAIRIKLVTKNELPLSAIGERCLCVCALWRFEVDELPVSCHARHLAGRIRHSEGEFAPTEVFLYERDNWVSGAGQ